MFRYFSSLQQVFYYSQHLKYLLANSLPSLAAPKIFQPMDSNSKLFTPTEKVAPLPKLRPPLIFGMNLTKVRGQMTISIDKNEVEVPIDTETIHGYKCRNLLQSHNNRIHELEKRILQPHMPARRVVHANYSNITPKALNPFKVESTPAMHEPEETSDAAKKTWRRISIASQFTFGVLHASSDTRKTQLKPKLRTLSEPPPQEPRSSIPAKEASCDIKTEVSALSMTAKSESSRREYFESASRTSVMLSINSVNTPGRRLLNRANILLAPRRMSRLPDVLKEIMEIKKTEIASRHPILEAQLLECREIMDRFSMRGLDIDERTLHRALIRPEEIVHHIPPPKKIKKVYIVINATENDKG